MITIPENFIVYFDIAIIVLYCISFIVGYRKGFLLQIISTVGTILCFYFAWRYASIGNSYFHIYPRSLAPLQDTLMKDVIYEYINEITWFFILFIAFRFVLYLFEKLVKGLKNIPLLRQISGLLGGILGLVVTTVWMMVFAILLNTTLFTNGRVIKEKSYLNQIVGSVNVAIENLGIPINSTEAFNKLYTDAQNISDEDKKIITKWLEDHGFETIEEMEAKQQQLNQGNPTGEQQVDEEAKNGSGN